ncbi:hypothetical protein [Streptomyces sp. NPDC059009]|uniref:hypothetical protein n=1 Tax=Streptomyces sp. NPDC059009 TaxID=3346694 RepID=UPI0036ABC10B
MTTPANGYTHYAKPAQFLLKNEEVHLGGHWYRAKRVTVLRDRVKVTFDGGHVREYAPHESFPVRRPAQWIAPQHTGVAWGMPGGAGRR